MNSFDDLIARAQQLAADLPPDSHSMQILSARQLIGHAIMNLQTAPTDMTVAIARLLARYEERQAETFTVREGLAISYRETTATKLAALVAVAQAMISQESGSATIWIDDGGMGLDLTADEIVENAAAYTAGYASRLAWVSAKRKEIEAAEDPLAVSLD